MKIEICEIQDPQSGASARIAPQLGFNCFSFQAEAAGEKIELLWSEEGFDRGEARPSGSGVPVLFPFPGRIGGTEFDFEGRKYQLEPGDAFGNAIHGFVYTRPWRVVKADQDCISGEFVASRDDPLLLNRWPCDFRIEASYTISAVELTLSMTVENIGERHLPFGLGAHPYLQIPPGGGAHAESCVVTAPVQSYWELANMMPTGRKLPSSDRAHLAEGVRFAEAKLDDVFADLLYHDGIFEGSVHDPVFGRATVVSFDDAFPHCVVYIPPHREAICIEPYSCMPDPFRLEAQGLKTGLRILSPDQSFTAGMQIRLMTS